MAALLVAASYADGAINLQAVAVLSVARKEQDFQFIHEKGERKMGRKSKVSLEYWQKSRFDGKSSESNERSISSDMKTDEE